MTTFTDKNVQNLQSLSSANTHRQHSSLQLHRISGAKNSHSVCPALTFCFSGNDVNATNKSVRLKVLQWVFGVTRSAFYLLDTMQKSTIITWWQTISVCLCALIVTSWSCCVFVCTHRHTHTRDLRMWVCDLSSVFYSTPSVWNINAALLQIHWNEGRRPADVCPVNLWRSAEMKITTHTRTVTHTKNHSM